MTNAKILASLPSGGTNCSAPLKELNSRKAKGDLIVYVSDNESWVDTNRGWHSGTATMRQWNEFKSRNSDAKLVCIDLQPNAHTQAQERRDILNVGGFSDQVFKLVSAFANGGLSDGRWVDVIEQVEI
jgi:60 kDa SS-A/Ro ribonucleoprotein